MFNSQETQDLTKKPVRFEMNLGYGQFFASLLTLGIFFVMPIMIVNNWADILSGVQTAFDVSPTASAVRVAGITTDNMAKYIKIPILNFSFDTTLRDPSTISFLFGTILLLLSILIILILFADFRRKEKKYR